MTIDERIAYADAKLDAAVDNESDYVINYWRGYIDALKAAKRDAVLAEAKRNGK